MLLALSRPDGSQPGPLYLLVLRLTPAPQQPAGGPWIWGVFSIPTLPDGCNG
jgi:hypothetical protein